MATVLSLRTPAGGFNALPERASGWDVAMKFRLKFKTPDVFDQLEEMDDDTIENVRELVAKFVRYGELVTIEFDTDTQTATVVEA